MTSLGNLVKKLDIENPEILNLFTEDYTKLLLSDIKNESLKAVKILIENYLLSLDKDILNKKVFVYKYLEDIKAEILINPVNTSIIVEYDLILSIKGNSFYRVK